MKCTGEEGSGKSTLCYLAAANAQKQYPDELVVYLDVEQAVDLGYAQKLGLSIDTDKFLLIQPNSGAEALQIMEDFVESGLCSAVILDSIAALITEQEKDGEAGDQFMAVLPRLLGAPIKRLITSAKRSNTACIFINQTRSTMAMYGSPTTTPGGKALKFGASLRLEVRKKEFIKKGDINIGQKMVVKTIKNRFGPPYGVTEIDLIFGEGVDQVVETVDVGIEKGIIKHGGAWFTVTTSTNESLRFQGRPSVYEYFRQNLEELTYTKSLLYVKKSSIVESIVDEEEEDSSDE